MTPPRGHTPQRTFRVPDDLWQAAQERAARLGVTVSSVLINALRTFSDETERPLAHAPEPFLDLLLEAQEITLRIGLILRAPAYESAGPLRRDRLAELDAITGLLARFAAVAEQRDAPPRHLDAAATYVSEITRLLVDHVNRPDDLRVAAEWVELSHHLGMLYRAFTEEDASS